MNKTNAYFRSNGYTPDEIISTSSGEPCDLSKLPPFLRTLLVMDGTVTKALEAWFWEPVKVVPLHIESTTINEVVTGLESEIGDKAIQREVILQGVNSERVFACARSTVLLKRLPKEIGEALESGKIGIGGLFREQGLETYREIIDIDCFSASKSDDELLKNLKGKIISRSYQIWVNHSPAIIVTEFFPIVFFNISDN
jgi:chorismate-pyruvate lyase